MNYKIGDIIKIKVEETSSNSRLISADRSQTYDESSCQLEKVQVVGATQGFHDYVVLYEKDPHGYFSFKINQYNQKVYDVSDKFFGQRGAYVASEDIWSDRVPAPTQQVVLHDPGGMTCKLCKNFIQYAGVNRDDNSFVCHKCVSTKGWRLTCQPIK